ncbi:MAG TPA: PIG-L deacetylase family protein [Candidatus Dormibacteraeota bacterium]|jgi:LmbE family N-acetylglucosaminyl deacetylase|nr:PIG-L deacetylase family protein [Candidatus Dormibacteraeota bacterium]
MTAPLRVLAFGAHPDDCDSKAGGVAALYAAAGHQVRFVSVTNGDAGHQEMHGAGLAWRRRAEAEAAARVIGIEYVLLDNHDGELVPSLENRRQVIRAIREFAPDLIMTPRPYDYHPDHRYTSQLVQDAAYCVTVPGSVGLTAHLERNPVIVYVSDHFQKPCPFAPDVVVDIGSVVERKLDMLHEHRSQMYEWLPYNRGILEQVPAGDVERRAWLGQDRLPHYELSDENWRARLVELIGPDRAAEVRYAEAFEACEYGAPLTAEAIRRLFPFLGGPE